MLDNVSSIFLKKIALAFGSREETSPGVFQRACHFKAGAAGAGGDLLKA